MNNTNNWTISKIYLYLVALITFSVLLFNFIILARVIPDYFFPLPGWIMDDFSVRNELFMRKYGHFPLTDDPEHTEKLIAFTPNEVEEFRNKRQAEIVQQNRQTHLNEIIRNLFSFILLLPLHVYFFKLARRS